MVAIGIDYLNGVSVATHPSDYESAEWPPHPARVYMALAAAHFESAVDEQESAAERNALEWLESLSPPEIIFAAGAPRNIVKHYVPVNDVKTEGVLPRNRQERFFPATVLGDESRVWMVWPDENPDPMVRNGLQKLAERVPRIGHSSSFVRVHLADVPEKGELHLIPSGHGGMRLRIPAKGFLSALEGSFTRGDRPSVGTWQGYLFRESQERKTPACSVFDPNLIVLRLREGRSLDLCFTAKVTDTLRRAIMANGPDKVPEVISGHAVDGTPSQRPHAAFLPLAFVDGEYADGHLMGLAIALPRNLRHHERLHAIGALSSQITSTVPNRVRLNLGRLGIWDLEVDRSEDPPINLQTIGYTRPSALWASITPIVLDRFAKAETEQEEIIAGSCERIGLPRPVEVQLSKIAHLMSVPPAWEFPLLAAGKNGPKRFHRHAVIRFAEPVRGPIILGAGRYRGYGLCRPIGGHR